VLLHSCIRVGDEIHGSVRVGLVGSLRVVNRRCFGGGISVSGVKLGFLGLTCLLLGRFTLFYFVCTVFVHSVW